MPSPTAFLPNDQRTPTGPRMVIPDQDVVTPTPMPRRRPAIFELDAGDRSETEEEDAIIADTSAARVGAERSSGQEANDLDVAGVTLDDDDFVSHYSRQDSSDSEEGVEEGEDDAENDHANGREERHQDGGASTGTNPPEAPARPDTLSRVRSLPARPLFPHLAGMHSHPQHLVGTLHTSQSTTSLPPPLPPPPLYPPFYNRPPTPLPPSPSLTSLLRPPSLLNRSTASTRPTTPDSSDVETPNDTEAAVAHSARRANPPPPTSPKVPTYEYYGFVLYLASTLAFLIYILWSYLPSPFLHAFGITYYPNRWWSLAIPAWIVMLLIFIYVALLSYNVENLTLPLASLECMVDDAANVAILDDAGRLWRGGSKRVAKEMAERAKLEHEMASARAKGGAGRRQSKSGPGGSQRLKDKGKRRTSHSHTPASPEAAPPEQHYPGSPRHKASSSLGYDDHGMYPAFTAVQQTQTHYDQPTPRDPKGYPTWNLVWNEGTDAVMDVPIGGVCEVLYG